MEHQAKNHASKLLFLKFSPASWWADTGNLTLEAKALWMEMLLLMHISPKRGYLLNEDGLPVTFEVIARRLRLEVPVAIAICNELEASGVFSRDGKGVIYSRRMRREQTKINEEQGADEAEKIEKILALAKERGIDVEMEMKKLHAYLLSHPNARYCAKIVTTWMNKAIPTLPPKRKARPQNFHCYSPPGRAWCGLGSREEWIRAGKPSEEDMLLAKRNPEEVPA
jgi:DNA-binding Lrp family transcriptional regulator